MATIKIYNPSMQTALEACFKACVTALGWEYQPDGRHSDMVSVEDKGLDIRFGDHSSISFNNAFFDFIYMTDVVHHVPDLNMMFAEFSRVLKPGGLVAYSPSPTGGLKRGVGSNTSRLPLPWKRNAIPTYPIL